MVTSVSQILQKSNYFSKKSWSVALTDCFSSYCVSLVLVCLQRLWVQHPGQPAVSYGAVRQQLGGAGGGTNSSLSRGETQGGGPALPDSTTVTILVVFWINYYSCFLSRRTGILNRISFQCLVLFVCQLCSRAAETRRDGSGWSVRLGHDLLQRHRRLHRYFCREHAAAGWWNSRVKFRNKISLLEKSKPKTKNMSVVQ